MAGDRLAPDSGDSRNPSGGPRRKPPISEHDGSAIAHPAEYGKALAKEHFQVDVEFGEIHEIGIDELFALVPSGPAEYQLANQVYGFKNGTGDRPRLVKEMAGVLETDESSFRAMVEYARPYLPRQPVSGSRSDFAEALVKTLLDRMEQWKSLKASDGKPVLDGSLYNEWAIWNVLGYGQLPYDVILTNQFIASVEYSAQTIHTALRGGISAGTATHGRLGGFGTYISVSTFVFSDDYAPLVQLRGGESYDEEEAARLAGVVLAHELGHMLFRYAHPYGVPECIMCPTEMLGFRKWFDGLDAEVCRTAGSPAMRKNSQPLLYNINW